MTSTIRALLVGGLFAVAGCTGADEVTAPTPASVADPDESTPTGTSVPASVSSDDGPGVGVGEVSTTIGDTDLTVSDSTTVSEGILGGAPPSSEVGGESLGPLGETDLDVETDEGTVQIGDAEVPSGLDPAFPLPGDLDVQLASETTSDLGFSGTTAGSIEELTAFYTTELPQSGYTITETQIVEGVLAVFTFEGRDRFGQVAVSETPGDSTSTVLVTIGDGAGQEATVSG